MPETIFNNSGVVVNRSKNVKVHQSERDATIQWDSMLLEMRQLREEVERVSKNYDDPNDVLAIDKAIEGIKQKDPDKLQAAMKKFTIFTFGIIKELGLKLLTQYLSGFMPKG